MKCKNNVIYGDIDRDNYLIIEDRNIPDLLEIVFIDYFYQENAIVFRLGHPETDWSDGMLLETAKEVVDLLNNKMKKLIK